MAQKYYGLCETCEHDATCTLRRSTQLKIIQCEEFTIFPAESDAPFKTSSPNPRDEDAIEGMGICANCLNVLSCGFPNARCGVIQCEEYILDKEGVVPPARSGDSRHAA